MGGKKKKTSTFCVRVSPLPLLFLSLSLSLSLSRTFFYQNPVAQSIDGTINSRAQPAVHRVDLRLEGRLGLRPLKLERRRQQPVLDREQLVAERDGRDLLRRGGPDGRAGPGFQEGEEAL